MPASASAPAPWTADDRRRALARLDTYLARDEMQEDREHGWTVFYGPLFEGRDDEYAKRLVSDPTSRGALLFWLLFDYRTSAHSRVVDQYLGRFPKRLGEGEQRWMEALRDSSARLWELVDVRPNEGFSALDVLDGKRVVEVRERIGSQELVRWDLLAARLVPVGNGGVHQVEGPPLPLPQIEKPRLLKELRAHRRRIAREVPEADEREFFEIVYPKLHDEWVETVAAPPTPQIVTAEGDSFLASRGVFDVRDEAALRAALDSHPELRRDEDGAPHWDWLEAGEVEGGARLLGTFILEGSRLGLETHSRRRAERGRALVEAAAGGAVRYRATRYQDPRQAIESRDPAGQGSAAEPEAMPAEVTASLMQEIKEKHYRGWVDEPIPLLGGRTPREAAKLKHVRPKLIALLKDLEAFEERGGRQGQPVYDSSWMWEELGLKRPRGG